MKHRVLVYCDDKPAESWGWWCRECPGHQAPEGTKASAERRAYRHADAVQIASGTSRATLRRAS